MTNNSIIFYTEDDPDDQEVFKDVLLGLNVKSGLHFQDNGDELLFALKNSDITPDILFLDLNMPGISGFHVLQEIREMEKFKYLPIIIFSTSSDPVAADRAKKLGANLFVTKPQLYRDLKKLIDYVLNIDWKQNPQPSNMFYINPNNKE